MNLRQLPNAVVRSIVEFRANLKENIDKANAGFPIVITRNEGVEAVLVSPEQAQRVFENNVPLPQLDPNAIEDSPIVEQADYYDVETGEEVMESELSKQEVAPPTIQADAVGVPPILNESSPAGEPTTNQPSPSVEEASVEVEESTPADASDELLNCPACVDDAIDIHETGTRQHPTEADLPEDAEIVGEVEVADEAPASAEEEAPETDEATVAQAPIECEVNVVASSVHCLRESVKAIRYNGAEFSICQYHLDQLEKADKDYEVISETAAMPS